MTDSSLPSRRGFVGTALGAVGAAAFVPGSRAAEVQGQEPADVPASIRALRPRAGSAVPITAEERRARIEKARRLMADQHIDALLLEPGSSFSYFTGVSWGLSERPFLVVI